MMLIPPCMVVLTSFRMSSPPMDHCDHGLVCHQLKPNNNSFYNIYNHSNYNTTQTFKFSSTIQHKTLNTIVIIFTSSNTTSQTHYTRHPSTTSNASKPSSIHIITFLYEPSRLFTKITSLHFWFNVFNVKLPSETIQAVIIYIYTY